MRMYIGPRYIAALSALALLVLATAGCPKNDAGGGSSGAPAGGGGVVKRYTIVVIPKGTKAQFWQSVNAGAQEAGKQENADIQFEGPTDESDIVDQEHLVENKINSGVNGIVLAACDAKALLKPAKDAAAKGIPVVTVDSGLADPNASVAYIATNNVAGGSAGADSLAKLIGEKGNVGLLIFQKGAVSSDDREKGFEDGIKKYPNIHLVVTLQANDPKASTDAVTNMLTAHPDLAGIFAANEPNGVAAANVLRQRGLAGKVKLVAYDSSDQEIQAVKDGIIQATVVQDPYQMGYLGVKTVLKAIRKQPVGAKYVDSGMTVVTKDNLNTPQVQKLINPQPGG